MGEEIVGEKGGGGCLGGVVMLGMGILMLW